MNIIDIKNFDIEKLKRTVEAAFDISPSFNDKTNKEELLSTLEHILSFLDQGLFSVAVYEEEKNTWHVNTWLKKAILLYFALKDAGPIEGSTPFASWDKIPLKFTNWQPQDFLRHRLRLVPGAIVRYGAYVGERTVLMPSFVNIGAYIGEETLIDTWATIGSCAYIGKRVHISGGTGIGGVLEPLQALPVIIEDDCFIGARCEIAEGVRIGKGSVIAMGTFIGASTKIVHRATQTVHYGYVPPYSVVVPGVFSPSSEKEQQVQTTLCAMIVKSVDEKTRSKTSLTQLLR